MTTNRYHSHMNELRKQATLLKSLAPLSERVSAKDLLGAVDAMQLAASALEELIRARPEGCVCDLIDDRYLSYAESCTHHGHLHVLLEALKAEYVKLEKTLKDETRLKLIAGALAGTAGLEPKQAIAKQAIAVADEVLKQLTDAST
jgi:hypothetical protein